MAKYASRARTDSCWSGTDCTLVSMSCSSRDPAPVAAWNLQPIETYAQDGLSRSADTVSRERVRAHAPNIGRRTVVDLQGGSPLRIFLALLTKPGARLCG